MKIKITLILVCVVALSACTNSNTPVPTLAPTAHIESVATPSAPLPATNTPIPMTQADETDVALEEIDREVCQEAVTTQSELKLLQEQGQDVTELATAVAELIAELEDCVILLTPTPFNK